MSGDGLIYTVTHQGAFPCNIHSGALVPRRSTTAGVPGPRRNADERDAGWFAPVATRRRPKLAAFNGSSGVARNAFRGTNPASPPGPPRGPLPAGAFSRWRGAG